MKHTLENKHQIFERFHCPPRKQRNLSRVYAPDVNYLAKKSSHSARNNNVRLHGFITRSSAFHRNKSAAGLAVFSAGSLVCFASERVSSATLRDRVDDDTNSSLEHIGHAHTVCALEATHIQMNFSNIKITENIINVNLSMLIKGAIAIFCPP